MGVPLVNPLGTAGTKLEVARDTASGYCLTYLRLRVRGVRGLPSVRFGFPASVASQHTMIQLIRSYELMTPGQIDTFPCEGSERRMQNAAERAVAH
jgi:hypothetical protein